MKPDLHSEQLQVKAGCKSKFKCRGVFPESVIIRVYRSRKDEANPGGG